MKSKTSFFNKTIFWKNVTLYWPIWGIYTLVLMFVMPFSLWVNVASESRVLLAYFRIIRSLIQPQMHLVWISLMGIITGMALFSYLYRSQSANMIHSFPVDRKELFGTNVISGLAFMILPLIATFIVTVLVCLGCGIPYVEYFFWWLLIAIAESVISFGFVTLCAFLTGQLAALPVYVIVSNFLAYALSGVIDLVVQKFAIGVHSYGIFSDEILIWLTPVLKVMSELQWEYQYPEGRTDQYIGLQLKGWESLVVYLILAVAFYVIAYFIYQRRSLEQAGDLITVKILKPIFRCGIGFFGGFYIGIFVTSILESAGLESGIIGFGIWSLIFGLVCYMAAEMLISKSFHVFSKHKLRQAIPFVAFFLISYCGILTYGNIQEKTLVAPDETFESLYLAYDGYYGEYTKEDLEQTQKIYELHRMIVENLEEFDLDGIYANTLGYLNLEYTYSSGRRLVRGYVLPNNETGLEIQNKIYQLFFSPENFLRSVVGEAYVDIEAYREGFLYVMLASDPVDDSQGIELDPKQTQMLYEAMIKDVEEYTVQKYNMDNLWYDEDEMVYSFSIGISYVPEGQRMSVHRAVNLNFGRDCKNIIAAIEAMGIEGIHSVDDIFWEKN